MLSTHGGAVGPVVVGGAKVGGGTGGWEWSPGHFSNSSASSYVNWFGLNEVLVPCLWVAKMFKIANKNLDFPKSVENAVYCTFWNVFKKSNIIGNNQTTSKQKAIVWFYAPDCYILQFFEENTAIPPDCYTFFGHFFVTVRESLLYCIFCIFSAKAYNFLQNLFKTSILQLCPV